MTFTTLLFWLFILSDGTAAALAARSAWARKLRSTGKRPEFATAFGIGFAVYAAVQYLIVFNNFSSARFIAELPPGYLFRSIVLRVVQSAAIWLISLTLMGRSPLTSLGTLFTRIRSKLKRKEQPPMSDKDSAAKDLVEDLDKTNPDAPPPAPQRDDEDDDDKDKKPGDPIGPGE